MVFKESKISFSVLSTPRASGLLQNKGSTRYTSTKGKKAKTSSHQQLHLLRRLLQHEFLRLDKLRDTAQPRSTLPPGRTTPSDSLDIVGVEAAELTTELTARFLEGEGGLRRRKAIKNKFKTQKSDSSYSTITATSGGGPPLPGPCRLDGRLVRRPVTDIRRHPTG